jgi:hypothetical protein
MTQPWATSPAYGRAGNSAAPPAIGSGAENPLILARLTYPWIFCQRTLLELFIYTQLRILENVKVIGNPFNCLLPF